jgi:exosortase/archaeosortase family protein
MKPASPPLPDEQVAATVRAGWHRVLLFATVFLALQSLWSLGRDSAPERLLIDVATVRAATGWINLFTPAVHAVAQGPRIRAPGGGINILNGCEGADLLFLLAAAFAACALPWRRRWAGLALGCALVYGLNQARVVGLFYAYRSDPAWFDLLHTLLAPVALIFIIAAYFHAWCHRRPAVATPR